ncbi:MAG: transposase, partial [Methanosarcinaceae archaeon]|nr:transposase [Methanosarcinaceae archaeon]
HDSGIIVANDVTQDCTDHHQLRPQLEKTEENIGKLPQGSKVSADNGYFTGDNLRYLEEKKLDGYIPFGNIKQNLGLREFFTRGLENVKTEHNLACIAHNMTVMWSKMGENVGVLF